MANRVLELLAALSIDYELFDHPPLYTVEDIGKLVPALPGANNKNLKNLFVKDKKGQQHLIVFVPEDKRVDLKALSKRLRLPNLSFASDERMKNLLGVTARAVSPLAVVNDSDSKVRVVIDQEFQSISAETLFQCHPLVNTQTVVLSLNEILKVIEACNHQVEFVEIPTIS